jgi:hypothetical protein
VVDLPLVRRLDPGSPPSALGRAVMMLLGDVVGFAGEASGVASSLGDRRKASSAGSGGREKA